MLEAKVDGQSLDYRPEDDGDLDAGIQPVVSFLRDHGVETYESCQGGAGHAYPVPTVRFQGDKTEGYRVVALLLQNGYKVSEVHRVWQVLDGELHGPFWEVTFPD